MTLSIPRGEAKFKFPISPSPAHFDLSRTLPCIFPGLVCTEKCNVTPPPPPSLLDLSCALPCIFPGLVCAEQCNVPPSPPPLLLDLSCTIPCIFPGLVCTEQCNVTPPPFPLALRFLSYITWHLPRPGMHWAAQCDRCDASLKTACAPSPVSCDPMVSRMARGNWYWQLSYTWHLHSWRINSDRLSRFAEFYSLHLF